MITEFGRGVGPAVVPIEEEGRYAGGRTRTGVRTTRGVTGLGEVMYGVGCGERDLYMTLSDGIGKFHDRDGQDAV